jgi:dTDP-glucose 4,6-dehydratase
VRSTISAVAMSRTNLEIIDRLCSALEELLPASKNSALRGETDQLLWRLEDIPGKTGPGMTGATRSMRQRFGLSSAGKPACDFETGIERTVRWYLAHRDWCTTVLAGTYSGERLGLGTS